MTALDIPFPAAASIASETPGLQVSEFKTALARLAGGLAIVSCWFENAPHGLLVSSITGLSLDPPRYLFCIRREASAHKALVGASVCGVSILSSEDEGEATTFTDVGLRALRFSGPWWRRADPHPPLLDSALTTATCLIDRIIDAGTHSIVLVTAQSWSVRQGEPLLSYNRGLRRLHPQGGERC